MKKIVVVFFYYPYLLEVSEDIHKTLDKQVKGFYKWLDREDSTNKVFDDEGEYALSYNEKDFIKYLEETNHVKCTILKEDFDYRKPKYRRYKKIEF